MEYTNNINEINNKIKNTTDFSSNVNSLVNMLTQWEDDLVKREEQLNITYKLVQDKQEEIDQYNKVSFFASTNKELQQKTELVKVLERRLDFYLNNKDFIPSKNIKEHQQDNCQLKNQVNEWENKFNNKVTHKEEPVIEQVLVTEKINTFEDKNTNKKPRKNAKKTKEQKELEQKELEQKQQDEEQQDEEQQEEEQHAEESDEETKEEQQDKVSEEESNEESEEQYEDYKIKNKIYLINVNTRQVYKKEKDNSVGKLLGYINESGKFKKA
jgi:hypothetical protein